MERGHGAPDLPLSRTCTRGLPPAPTADLEVHATSDAELLVASSRFGDVESRGEVVLVDPSGVKVQVRGRDAWEREVHDVAVDQVPARHLMVGETFNIAGGWSSFPPHKHDGADGEPELEEAYTFRFDPPDGFGFQAVERAGDPASLRRPRRRHGRDPERVPPRLRGTRLSPLLLLGALGPVRRLEMVEDARYSWLHEQT